MVDFDYIRRIIKRVVICLVVYKQNKEIIGGDPKNIYKGQVLQIPEDNSYFYSDYETCYEDAIAETFHWEGIEPYIDPDCGYEIQNCIFYYTVPEGEGEQFKICYPRLIAHNGKDVSAVNAGIRERAMKMAEALQTNGYIDGRHFMNIFLIKDGVGFSFSYRVGQEIDGSYSIMRGWTKTILSKEQVAAYMTDAPVLGEWLE